MPWPDRCTRSRHDSGSRRACCSLRWSLAPFAARRPARAAAHGPLAPGRPRPIRCPPTSPASGPLETDADVAAKSNGCIAVPPGRPRPARARPRCASAAPTATAATPAPPIKETGPRPARGIPKPGRPSGNPVRSYTLLNHESPEFIRFVNPGDLRVAHISCGTAGCHPARCCNNRKSMMTHGCMLWGAALYNNGAFPLKQARFGESYSMNGVAAADRRPCRRRPRRRCATKGVRPVPRPAARASRSRQPGNILRIFERGGTVPARGRHPRPFEDPGRPRDPAERPRPGHREPHRPRLPRPAEDAPARPDAQLPRHQRPPRRLPLQRLHRLPRHLRQRPLAGPLRPLRQVRQPRPERLSTDPTIPKDEPGHPIEHQFATGRPDQPVHRLPHPPRHQRHEQLPRLHVVGRGDRRRADVSARAEAPHRRGVHPARR